VSATVQILRLLEP